MTDTPRIYVSCLAAYNNGKLHGAWIDADQDPDDIWSEINQMLSKSPEPDAEEWAIHDYENFFSIKLSEYEDIEKVSETARQLVEHGTAYAAYVNNVGIDYATLEDFEDTYMGCWDSEEDYAYHLWKEMGIIKKLKECGVTDSYIDWEQVARDLFIDSYWSHEESYHEVYVFTRQ